MSTLKDVAALAQCSLTTASIVANGRGDEMHISPATQQRVAEAIQQLQYRPDRGAQLLRAGRRRLTIALYWPLDHRTTLLGDRLYNFYSILQQEQEPADPYELLIQTYFSGRLGEMLSPSCRAATMASSSAGPASRISFSWKMRIFPPLLFSSMPKAGSIPPPG